MPPGIGTEGTGVSSLTRGGFAARLRGGGGGVSVISTFESVWEPVSIPSQSQELAEMPQDQVSPNSVGLNAFK